MPEESFRQIRITSSAARRGDIAAADSGYPIRNAVTPAKSPELRRATAPANTGASPADASRSARSKTWLRAEGLVAGLAVAAAVALKVVVRPESGARVTAAPVRVDRHASSSMFRCREADDALQEAWIKVGRAETSDVDNLGRQCC